MILLDTNVVSETMRLSPDPTLVAWLNAQVAETIYLSTVSLGELLLGIAILPDGRRKADLASVLAERMAAMFGPRMLDFDVPSAWAYASIVSKARAEGRAIGLADGLIASTAATTVHGLAIATRDTRPLAAAGVPVLNPWRESRGRN